jgi:hypothetical protein
MEKQKIVLWGHHCPSIRALVIHMIEVLLNRGASLEATTLLGETVSIYESIVNVTKSKMLLLSAALLLFFLIHGSHTAFRSCVFQLS